MAYDEGMRAQIARIYTEIVEETEWLPVPSFSSTQASDEIAARFPDDPAARYTEAWIQAEDRAEYWLGVPDYRDREALIYLLEAARALNSGYRDAAEQLIVRAWNQVKPA